MSEFRFTQQEYDALTKVQDILRNGAPIDMYDWHGEEWDSFSCTNEDPFKNYAECGTAHCIGGYMEIVMQDQRHNIAMMPRIVWDIEERAQFIGGFSMFYKSSWPNDFEFRYDSADNDFERSLIAAEVIEHYKKIYEPL